MAGMSAEYVIVTSTTDTEEAARELAAGAVAARHGACAQIVGPIISVFRWNGEVKTEREWRVEVKTAANRADAMVGYLEANHGYDVPEVIVVPISGGSAPYLSWLIDETR